MTWIKICGITSVETATRVAERQPNAIGLNFYKPSPRFIANPLAARIRAAIPAPVECVGVFVNAAVETLIAITQTVGLDSVQLHGDEAPTDILQLRHQVPEVSVCKAFRIGEDGLSPVRQYLATCRAINALPDRILVDARVPGVFGGSGHVINWDLVNQSQREAWLPPMILAGGLTPDNIADAIHNVAPWGVDVASGVEDSSGDKDDSLVKNFVENANAVEG